MLGYDFCCSAVFNYCLCLYLDPSIVDGNVESAKVIDLIPWMEYEFRVMATNILGTGDPSIPSQKIRTEGSRTYKKCCI